MSLRQYFVALMLGLVCIALGIGIVAVSIAQSRVQREINMQQMQLNAGILGQRGQQVGASILQDLAAVAVGNDRVKRLLGRHGYTVQAPGEQAGAGTNAGARTTTEE